MPKKLAWSERRKNQAPWKRLCPYPENYWTIAFLVEVPSHHTVLINITLPEDVLSIVDQRARRLNLSRSAFLAEAALHFGKQFSNNIQTENFF